MAIEPLSSAMTYQAQTVARPQTVTPVNTEVPEDGQTVNVDATTAAVSQAQSQDEKSSSDGSTSQQQQTAKNSQAAPDRLKKMIEEMNRKINNSNEIAMFGIHEDTNRIMIKIMDKDTKEVIKEFPPEKTLDMIAKIWEMAGILIDERR